MKEYVLFWICIVGLCLGSFFNVVILRSLSNESIVFPASKCPKCGNKLYWWHNIPVLSYLFLRGKCYFCKEKISIQYPLIELLTMFLFAAVFLKFEFSIKTIFAMLWISGFIIMTATDIKERLVDCNIAIVLGLTGGLYNYLTYGMEGLISSVLGLMAGAVILEVIARFGYLFAGSRAMGEADTYVAGAMGAMFGLQNIGWVLLYAFAASMVFIIPLFLYNQYKNNNRFTCVMSVIFITSVLVFTKAVQNYWTLALLIISGILLAVSVLKNIKTEENRNYLPYVPAFAVGALYFIFFSINF